MSRKVSVEQLLKNYVIAANGCWEWTKHRNKDGYGMARSFGVLDRTHRWSWRHHFGEIPEGLFVCHKCDNPPCINPAHLFLGTQRDNNYDSMDKGRFKLKPMRGQKNIKTKFTVAQVLEIRSSKDGACVLAKRLGVWPTTIYRIRKGENWRWLW